MNIITKFLSVQSQLRIYHWQTKSYAEHQALGGLYDDLGGQIDEFVETLSGKRGGVPVSKEAFSMAAENYKSKKEVMDYLDGVVTYLTTELPTYLDKDKDSDLLNIRDEMLGSVNKTKYLLRLS